MKRAFAQAVAARVFANASTLVCGLISLRLLGQYLEPKAYGVVVVALAIGGYLPMLDGGFRTTLNRALLGEVDERRRARLLAFGQNLYTWLGLIVLAAAAVLLLGYAFTPPGRASGQPLLFFLALGLTMAAMVISSTQTGLLLGLQAQGTMYFLSGIYSWAALAALWPALHGRWGVWAFPLSTLAGVLGTFPFALALIRARVPGLPILSFRLNPEFWEHFRQLRGDAWAVFRSQMSILLLYSVDVVIVGMLCSLEDAAIYGVLSHIFRILRTFLQSTSEIAWPIIAQRGWGNQRFIRFIARINAWAVGSVTGAVALTLAPFCVWFMGRAWAAPQDLVWLMAGRFLITSLAAPPAFVLYGAGDFRVLGRALDRELIVACALALPLGLWGGLHGIAWAFLLATAFGTGIPVIRAYAAKIQEALAGALGEMWWRAALSFAISLLGTWGAMRVLQHGAALPLAGALGAAAGMGSCFLVSLVRVRRTTSRVWSAESVAKWITSV